MSKYLIPNPQIDRKLTPIASGRSSTVFSLQTFKRWKRVDDLVRAVPYMKSDVVLAGGGIEYYYMTSSSKRKDDYGTIWEEAIEAGMTYLGYIDECERDKWLASCRLLVDPSWSESYAKQGSHFNRTFVDAVIMGCMPAGTDLLMDGNSMFSPYDYVTIPAKCSPDRYAEILDESVAIPPKLYEDRLRSLQEVVRTKMDSKVVASRYLEVMGL